MQINTISVIGLGYVGLPLAAEFSKKINVIGFDTNKTRINELNDGIDKTGEVQNFNCSKLRFTDDPTLIKEANIHIVAVPTPVDSSNTPDLTALKGASKVVGENIKAGDIVVFESTVFPGATEDICGPIIEKASGFESGKDFFLGYSPERINPGDKNHSISQIVKVVSGQTPETLEKLSGLYSMIVKAGIHKAPSIKVAEAAKVIENIQRDVNIALMNELAIIFDKLDIDTYDVLEASKTKWNFLPFTPGLVGGHCIGVDPYYLTHKASEVGYIPQMILSGRRINDEMGRRIARKVVKEMAKADKNVLSSVITIVGFTFKENVPDVRNTKVIDIIKELNEFGATVQVIDPRCDPMEVKKTYGIEIVDIDKSQKSDCIILAVPHLEILSKGWSYFDQISRKSTSRTLIFDIKGVLSRNTKNNTQNILIRI